MEPNPVRIEELLAHAGWVRKLAARLVRDAGTADDVTQEVWAHALRSPPQDRRNLRGWLRAVVHNAARALGRSQDRRLARESKAATAEPASEDLVERAELHRRLVEQVMALAEPHRSIVLAHWFEGESLAEIARRQGLTPKMARTRLEAAHAQLRRRLDDSMGGRDAWCLAFVNWMAPRQLAATSAAIGGVLLTSKVVVLGVAAVLILLGWLAWSRPPVQQAGDQALAQSTLTSPDVPQAIVTTVAPEPRQSAATPEPKAEGRTDLTLLDASAITGRVHSLVQGFRPDSVTVIALEASAAEYLVKAERLSQIAAKTSASPDGSFQLAGLSKDHTYTILAGGDGWVSTVAELAQLPFARTGDQEVDLAMTRLFAAVLELRDQDEPAHLNSSGHGAPGTTNGSSVPGAIPSLFMSAEDILAGASPGWASPIAGSLVCLFRADCASDELGPNRLEFKSTGYADATIDYVAWSVRQQIEPTRIALQRTVTAFGAVRVRFMADAQHLAATAACPIGKLILRPESGEPLEYFLKSAEPETEISNIPIGRYRLLFAPRMGRGTIPDSEAEAPLVEITPGSLVEFPVSVESFGSVRLVLLTESRAPHQGFFTYRFMPAKRNATTGMVTSVGNSEIRSGPKPPSGFQGLRAGTYILACLSPRPTEPSPEAGRNEVVVEVIAGQEQTLTVRLRTP